MSTEYDHCGADDTLTTQAIVELTEANLSSASDEPEWSQEVRFLREDDEARQGDRRSAEVDEVIDLSTLLS